MKSSVEFVSLGVSMYTAIAVLIPPTIFFVKTLMETNHQPPSSVFNKFFNVRFQCGGSPQTIFSLWVSSNPPDCVFGCWVLSVCFILSSDLAVQWVRCLPLPCHRQTGAGQSVELPPAPPAPPYSHSSVPGLASSLSISTTPLHPLNALHLLLSSPGVTGGGGGWAGGRKQC